MSFDYIRIKKAMNSNKSKDDLSSGEINHFLAFRRLLRARTRLIVCFWTLPVYILVVWALLSNRQPIDSFMFCYFSLCAGFWIDMARRRCPVCAKQFYVKSIILNLRTKKCVHCGLGVDSNLQE